ncbi:ring-cleaving dioxygenase [Rubrobacter taiwanensis]|uniref:Ring-cleaving dioxygenase n=1 Tax=Rubrobacter taiwanensis TaxID=185139 RepID=A0A4R1BLZ9_9ACTN|nr:ring-cleaving dioxygenase [Rubrobacter taiwanensis]TCJ18367.1 ring-cleaving dioxygenase [Rubrobacter taiwanensis]
MQLGGLHHVTAVTADAPGNVAFYTGTLGMRLVKKTVNQDDVSAYHLFYGDELGRPGTEMTFFDWAWAPPREARRGMISSVAFRVSGREALEWWAARFDELGVERGEVEGRGGRVALRFADPEGQRLELVDDGGAALPGGVPWERSPVPGERGIRGLDSVTLTVKEIGPTAAVLTRVLGFRKVDEYLEAGHRVAAFEVGPGGPGARLRVEERPDLPPHRRVGAGGVHHVAFRAPDEEEHAAWWERLTRVGLMVSPIIDRYYFRSIYFREPGGVLFEIATDGPGFATDEDPARLGERLSLPPFLEDRREEIEANLRPLPAGQLRS